MSKLSHVTEMLKGKIRHVSFRRKRHVTKPAVTSLRGANKDSWTDSGPSERVTAIPINMFTYS